MKKFFRYFAVIILLIISLISPIFVSRTAKAGSIGGYQSADPQVNADYIELWYLTQIANACVGGYSLANNASDSLFTFYDREPEDGYSVDRSRTLGETILNIRLESSGTKLYDSYLERIEASTYSDGVIKCNEIRDSIIQRIINIKKSINPSSSYSSKDIMCGTNGQDGLYKISVAYYIPGSQFEYHPIQHNGMVSTVKIDGMTLYGDYNEVRTKDDCKSVLNTIESFSTGSLRTSSALANSTAVFYDKDGNQLDSKDNIAPGYAISINSEFNMGNYFGVPADLDAGKIREERMFQTLMNTSCVTESTKELYDAQQANANVSKDIVRIRRGSNFYYVNPIENEERYFHEDSDSFTSNRTKMYSCSELAEMVAAQNATGDQSKADDCKTEFENNQRPLKRIITLANQIHDTAETLATAASKLASGESTSLPYQNPQSPDTVNKLMSYRDELSTMAGDGMVEATNKLITESGTVSQRAVNMFVAVNGLAPGASVTDGQAEELAGLAETYAKNIGTFKTTYVDKLNDVRVPEAYDNYGTPYQTNNFYYIDENSPEYYVCNSEQTLKESRDAINRITGGSFEFEPYVNPDGPSTPGVIINDNDVAGEDPCFHTAESMGWILCPVLKGIVNAAEGLYEEAVEPFLVVDTQLFNTNNGAYSAWRVFANIANVIAVIFLLFIVFSQITGVGIDNYGIKKSLPKIIVAAILINLSYIICQLAVDSSNIIGQSLESLLTGIGNGLPYNSSTIGAVIGETPSAMFKVLLNSTLALTGLIAGLGVTGAVLGVAEGVATAGVIGGVFEGIGIIIPILVGVLGVLIAVLTFFVMLGLRQIAVILLVVISPVAFVCYMLPNTRNLFKKWWNILKAMLILYPMAGLTIGGCHLVSSILLSTNATQTNFLFYLLNMIVMALPLLLIPSLVSKSMGALGDITSKIRDFGQGVRQRAQRRASYGMSNARRFAEGRAGFQAARQEAAERQKYRVGRASDRLARRRENSLNKKAQRLAGQGRELSASDQARLDRYRRTQADWATDREATGDRVSDRSFYAGYANQRRSESSSKNKDTRQWADSRYASAQEKKADTRRRMDYGETMQWNYDGIAQAALDDNRNKLNERMARAKAGVVVKSQSVLDRQAENQHNLDVASNNLDVTPEISQKYANSLAKQRFDTAQQKMYSEELTNLKRSDIEAKLNEIVKGAGDFAHDTNYLEAVLSALRSKGGSVEIAQAMRNVDGNTPSEIVQELNTFAATMSEQPLVKQYGKDVANGNFAGGNFSQWLSTNGVAYIENNPKLMAGMDKDQLDLFGKIYADNPTILNNTASVLYAATGATTSDEQAKSRAIIDTYVNNTAMQQRAADLGSIPISEFVKMQPEIFSKLVGGLGPNGELTGVGSNDVEMEATLHQIHSVIGQAGGNTLAALDPKIRAALESRFGSFGATASSGTPTAGQSQGGNNSPTTGTEVFGEDGGGI